ncbi:MAG: phage portal protein [Bryobacteraceae bacterium]|jgi:HK97 family phage portal protein
MGWLSNNLGIKAFSLEDPAQPLLPMSALFESLGIGRSDAGMMVNEKQALRLTTAYGCIKIISEDLSRISLDIFQQMPDDSMRLATMHRCYPLLHDRPNPNMSSQVWRAAMLASVSSYGNGYSWIKRDKAARAIALVPLDSGRTSPVKINGEFAYATTQTDTGQVARIDPENMLHFMGLSLDGIVGLSPIQLCKNAFGLSMAAEKFGAQFFGNGARATGVLSHPQTLEPEAYENLKKSLREWATGETALRPVILEEGMKWEQISIPPEDAQFIATRKFQKEEIACLYRVPMHLLQDLQRATNNNIEHQGLDYVRFCLSPRAVNMEQEINYKLLGGPFFCEHNFMDLTRGDFASQTAGLMALRNGGIYHADDVLRALRQNPIGEADGGHIRIVQGAYISLTSLLPGEEDNSAAGGGAGTNSDEGNPAADLRGHQIIASYRRLFRDAVGRAINRGGETEFTRRAIYPAVASMAQALVAQRFGNAELSRRELEVVESQVAEIAPAAAGWQKKDAAAIAARITEQVYGALALEVL